MTGPITYEDSIKAARTALTKASEAKENLLMPSDSLNNVPAMHKVTVEKIKLSPDPDDRDVYVQSGKDDDPPDKKRYAPTKDGLLKLSSCAGVQWDYEHSGRIDDQRSGSYIAWRMVGAVQRLDGSWLPLQGAYDIDFEVVGEQIEEQKRGVAGKYWANAGWWKKLSKDAQEANIQKKVREDLLNFKRHKVARCETGAMLRAIRGLLNIKGTYSYEELQKPFVIARLVFQPDYADPYIKAEAVKLAFQAVRGIYGIQSAPQPQQRQQIGLGAIDLEQDVDGGYGVPRDIAPPGDGPPDDLPKTKGKEASSRADFMACDKPEKVAILNALMERKSYEMKSGRPLEAYSEEGLLAFYDNLAGMEDSEDEIPF